VYCPNCGYQSESSSKFCPECGVPQTTRQPYPTDPQLAQQPAEPVSPEAYNPPNQEPGPTEGAAYIRQDYNPARDGRFEAAARQPGAAPAPEQPRTTGMVVFSIINMLCCGLGVGFILGIIALIFALMASSDDNPAQSQSKIKTARTLNIIGLVFIIVQVIAFFVFFGAIILATAAGEYPPFYYD